MNSSSRPIRIEKSVDVAYLQLSAKAVAATTEHASDVLIDWDAEGRAVGVELLHIPNVAEGRQLVTGLPAVDLWMDDLRAAPAGWVHAFTAAETILALQVLPVRHVSLDHDLGEGNAHGTAVTDWLAEHGAWPAGEVKVHSANPVGADTMRRTISRYRR